MQNLGEQAVSVEVKAGDAIFLDPLVFHGAGSGTKSKARVVLTLALRSVDELAMGVAANELLVGGAHHYAGQEEWMRTYG
jgi:ectoine hydroxylase-related dioxygenase (phytanoyl-CoA dioxygenase family)